MNNTEKLIQNLSIKGKYLDYTKDEWIMVINYLLSQLEILLGVEVSAREEDFKFISNGFCIRFNTNECLGPTRVNLQGLIGTDVLESESLLRISSTIFLCSQNDRFISLGDSEKAYFEIEYMTSDDDDIGYWNAIGWKKDEHDEF
jgi:hypothetical protein